MSTAVVVPPDAQGPEHTRAIFRWIPLGAILLASLYLPTLATRFDFIDDGNLVYPTGPLPLDERAHVVWQKIVANYEHLGPFRPVLWCHWELAADLLQGSELGWRVTRLIWCAFAAALLLWLFLELGIAPAAALAAGAIAMWNPYRNEIWTSLTLAEGVAMPYALLALVCARRAAGSRCPWAWDVLGACVVLAALGCKNTFAALVPAQMFLRVAEDGMPLSEGWRRHGRRALVLSLTLLLPAVHFAYFKWNWHPGQYLTAGPTLGQGRRIFSALCGAVSVEWIGIGLALAVLAQLIPKVPRVNNRSLATAWLAGLMRGYRGALGAGAVLLVGGIAIYLPMDAISGRYTMPAVWGLDLIIAVVLSGLPGLRTTRRGRVACAALVVGLMGVLVSNLGKQQKFAARSRLLWDVLESVEQQAPPDAHVAWFCGDSLRGELNVEEGIHFQWHLAARGRRDVRIGLYDERGQPLVRPELPVADGEPLLAIWSGPAGPCTRDWEARQTFIVSYWAGRRRYECCLGERVREGLATTRSRALPSEERLNR
jgi:hypothetical protein